jgi:hypothetical protein
MLHGTSSATSSPPGFLTPAHCTLHTAHCMGICRGSGIKQPDPGSRQITPGGNSHQGFHEWGQTISPLVNSPLFQKNWCNTLRNRLAPTCLHGSGKTWTGLQLERSVYRPVGRQTGIMKSLLMFVGEDLLLGSSSHPCFEDASLRVSGLDTRFTTMRS